MYRKYGMKSEPEDSPRVRQASPQLYEEYFDSSRAVKWSKARLQWCAKTIHDDKKYTLGYFPDKRSAVSAYQTAARARQDGTLGEHLLSIGAKVTVGSRGPNRPKLDLNILKDHVLDEHYFPDGRKRKRRRKYTGPMSKGLEKQLFAESGKPKSMEFFDSLVELRRPQRPNSNPYRPVLAPKPAVKFRSPTSQVIKTEDSVVKSEGGNQLSPTHKALLDDLKPRPVVTKLLPSRSVPPILTRQVYRPPLIRGSPPRARSAPPPFGFDPHPNCPNPSLERFNTFYSPPAVRMDQDLMMPELESPETAELRQSG